jgi:murein DD-endopeptidase MepM/ murein hydrolase activator NlpD
MTPARRATARARMAPCSADLPAPTGGAPLLCSTPASAVARSFVLTALLAVAVPLASSAPAWGQGATGGTLGPAAIVRLDVSDAGGAQAPVGQGTGGSEYGFVSSAPHRSPSRHRSASHHGPPRSGVRGVSRSRSHHTASHPHRAASKPARKAPKPAPKSQPKPPPKPAPKPAPPAEQLAGVPTPAQTVSDGAVFPVRGPHSFGGPENRFGAPRSGHTHQGQDILAAEGLPDVAPLAGSVIATGNQPGGAGWYVAEHTSVGFDFFFAHCEAKSVQVSAGQAVSAGTVLCKLGSTGDATAPHLHFEMWVGGWHAKGGRPIDPLPYLEAWEGR